MDMPTLMPGLLHSAEPQWHIRHGVLRGCSLSLLGSCLSAGERSRQPEPCEDAVLEAGHGADPVAAEGEDVEAGAVADARGGAQVRPGRPVAPGPRRPH